MKSILRLLTERFKDMLVVVFGAPGWGRFDQTIHAINALYQCKDQQILLLDEYCMTFLLQKVLYKQCSIQGENTILMSSSNSKNETKLACGILPVGEPALLSTKGLEWNISQFYI